MAFLDNKIAAVRGEFMQRKSKSLVDIVDETRQKVLKQKNSLGVPYCDPQKVANYLLAFAGPDSARKVDGICYSINDEPVILSSDEIGRRFSEYGDGIFSPLLPKQIPAFKKALVHLNKINVAITPCPNPFSSRFFYEDTNYLKIILYSYNQKGRAESHGEGRTFDLTPADPKIATVHLLGIANGNPSPVATFVHEIGHILGLKHFPPNFGTFSAECGPEYDDPKKFPLIQKAMEKNLCAVDGAVDSNPGSVMFCNVLESFDDYMPFTEGDKIAFKKQYDKRINDPGVKDSSTKHKKRPKTKVELAIAAPENYRCNILPENVCYYVPGLLDIAGDNFLDGALIGGLRGSTSAVAKILTPNTTKACLINEGLFYSCYFMGKLLHQSQYSLQSINYTAVSQVGMETLGLAAVNLGLSMANSFVCRYAGYAYCGVTSVLSSSGNNAQALLKLPICIASNMIANYRAQHVTEQAVRTLGRAFCFFKKNRSVALVEESSLDYSAQQNTP
jgi:hypothetical protein